MDLISIIKYLDDPRREQGRIHSLESIMYISIAAVIGGAESWNEVEEFGHLKEDFFASRIKGFSGVPSHDTFNRVFSLLDPMQLERCFRVWIKEICDSYKGVVAIDGKTVCGARRENPDGSFDKLHIVSAWATANGISLGQERVKGKSNEITAIPALIKALDLSECTVTIDAMGCQKEITSAIIEKGADYVICLKKNQRKFHETVSRWFDDFQHKHVPPIRYQTFTTTDEGHGRYERRHCEVFCNGLLGPYFKGWEGLQSIVKLTSLRRDIKTGVESEEVRYYISSIGLDPERILRSIRAHWGIENNLHWHLDVTFNEDSTRKTKNAAANFSLLNKIALMVVKNSSKKGSLKAKRKAAGWDNKVLAQMLDEEWNF